MKNSIGVLYNMRVIYTEVKLRSIDLAGIFITKCYKNYPFYMSHGLNNCSPEGSKNRMTVVVLRDSVTGETLDGIRTEKTGGQEGLSSVSVDCWGNDRRRFVSDFVNILSNAVNRLGGNDSSVHNRILSVRIQNPQSDKSDKFDKTHSDEVEILIDLHQSWENQWSSFWQKCLETYGDRIPWLEWHSDWIETYGRVWHQPDRSLGDWGQQAFREFDRQWWRIFYRRFPERIQSDLFETTIRLAQHDILDLGEWMNRVMDECPQPVFREIFRYCGDLYRERGLNTLACVFYNQIVNDMGIVSPREASILREKDVTGHAIAHFYMKHGSRHDGMKLIDRVLLQCHPDASDVESHRMMQLQFWYHERAVGSWVEQGGVHQCWDTKVQDTIGVVVPHYHPSSCSITETGFGILRSVNYEIVRDNGSYRFDGTVRTQNFWITVDPLTGEADVSSIRPIRFPDPFRRRHSHIEGIEDMRVFLHPSFPTLIYALGTSFEYGDRGSHPCQVLCVFDATSRKCTHVFALDYNNHHCQKNWIPFVLPDQKDMNPTIRIIYGWNPYKILALLLDTNGLPLMRVVGDDAHAIPLHVEWESPQRRFRTDHFRGSTQPVYLPELNEWHAVVHEVYHTPGCSTRRYRHRVVRLDHEAREMIAVTTPFVFEDNQIEYSLGLACVGDRMLIHYSIWDNHSCCVSLDIHEWIRWVQARSHPVSPCP